MVHTLPRYLTLSILATASLNCFAGAFQIEQSASGMGNAYAGSSALVEDASIAFYNPAGMVFLNRTQGSFAAKALNVNSDVEFRSSTIKFTGGPTIDAGGNTREDAGGWFALGSGYIAMPFCCNKFAVGLAVTTPWNLSTNYTNDAMARYLATHSRLSTLDISPTVAWQPFCGFSIGAGFDAQYLSTSLRQQVFAFNPAVGQLPDSSIDNSGDDWGYGWNVGLMYHVKNTGTTLGAAYRSRVEHSLEGSGELVVPAIGRTFAGPIEADVTLPDVATFSIAQDFCNCWTVLGSASWTHWSVIDLVTLNYSGDISGVVGRSSSTSFDFEDSWRYSVGVNFKPDECWKLRTGIMFDNSPVENVRTFRLPDSDRIWVAVGANYRINRMFNVDLAYAHLFVDNAQINQSALLGPATFNAQADIKSSVNEFAMQLNIDFC